MTLLTPDQVPGHQIEKSFGHTPWPWAIFLAIFGPAPPVVSWILWQQVKIAGWPVYIAAAVIVPLGFLFWLLVVTTTWGSIAACFRKTNWVMKTTPLGVLLKFRSHLNWHFPEDAPTIIQLDWSEIAAARRYRWRTTVIEEDERMERSQDYMELDLRDVDTEPIREAIAAETARKPPKKRISSRANHVPVLVARPGVLHVDWRGRAMLRAVEKMVAVAEPRDSGPQSFPEGLDISIDELARRGHKMQAIAEARRRHGLNLKEARDHVNKVLEGEAKAGGRGNPGIIDFAGDELLHRTSDQPDRRD